MEFELEELSTPPLQCAASSAVVIAAVDYLADAATEGGAIYVDVAVSDLKITNSIFSKNRANIGGAIAHFPSPLFWRF